MRPIDLFYRALNVPMRALLQSPLHGFGSRHLCLLTYRGRKSGREFTTPLSFTREGNLVRLLSSHQTRWWKNFPREDEGRDEGDGIEAGAKVEVEIARTRYNGRATTVIRDGDRLRDGVRSFLTALPRDAVVYGIKLDEKRRPLESDIETAAGHVVLVEIQLGSDA